MQKNNIVLCVVALALICSPLILINTALAEYTPLISSDTFDGIRADVWSAASGIISVVLVILGVGILVKVFTR